MKFGDLYFFNSLFLSRLSDQLVLFLVPLVVYKITGSVSISGVAFFLETLPRFIAFPISGILCDYFSPLTMLRHSQKIRFFIIPLGLLGHQLVDSVYWLIAISSLSGIATSFGIMSRELILPKAFNKGRYEKVLSYTSLSDQLGMVLGPILATYLISIFDWQISIFIAACLFLISDLSIYVWHRKTPQKITAKSNEKINFFHSSKLSFIHIFNIPGLFPAILLAISINLILGTTLATMAPIFIGVLEQSNYSYGILQTLGAISTIFILLFIARYRMSLTTLGLCGFTFMSIGATLTSLSNEYVLYSIGFLLILSFDKMFNIFLRSLRARVIPYKDLGKTTGFIVLLNNISQPVSGLIVALYASNFGAQRIALLTSSFAIFIGISVFIFLAVTNKMSFEVPS